MRPLRQYCSTKPVGEVQWERQISFVRVTCQRPPANNVAAEMSKVGPTSMDPMRPNPIRPTNAATPKNPQTRKWGTTKATVPRTSAGLLGCPFSRRVRPWYARAIGSADGSIIATIITTMSAKKRTRTGDPNAAGAISAFAKSDEVQVTYHARTTKAATPRPTGIVRRRNRFAGVARSLDYIGDAR